jgi:tryptophan halogenase
MDPAPDPLHRVVIVGGGAAGWTAALFLNRLLRATGCAVSLVESVKTETQGVGEGTLPDFSGFLREMRMDEARFMQQCSATYKLATRLADWGQAGSAYWLPYGFCGGLINDMDLFHFWLKAARLGRDESAYASYSLQALVAERDLAPRAAQGPSPIMESGAFGYHLDTAGFADFIREIAVAEGVHHLFDELTGVQFGDGGDVTHLTTKAGRAVAGDLFLDCTGGDLIGAQLGDPWADWSAYFPCDRAVLLPAPRDPRMPSYTQVTAAEAGWVWQVPISHRVGCGYAYASRHLGADEATRQLIARVGNRKAAAAAPRHVKLRAGRRTHFWVKNCIALGSAAGECESLEGAAGALLLRGLKLLAELLPGRTGHPALRDAYNREMAALHDHARDFLLLPYALSSRADTPFWRDVRETTFPDSVTEIIALHGENGTVRPPANPIFRETAYHHVFAGNGRLPRRIAAAADALDFAKVEPILAGMKAQNAQWLAKFPSHKELMDQIHRPPV